MRFFLLFAYITAFVWLLNAEAQQNINSLTTKDIKANGSLEVNFIVPDKRSGFGISTITLEFNATNTWGSPAATETIQFSDIHGLGFKEFLTHSYRFCRVVMTSTLGYCEISNLFIGKKLNINRSVSFSWTYKDDELSIKKSNRYGQVFTDVITRQKTISAALRLLDKNQLAEFYKAYDYCGESKPFFIRLGRSPIVTGKQIGRAHV